MNMGNALLSAPMHLDAPPNLGSALAFDWDGDGKRDIVAAISGGSPDSFGGGVAVYINIGNGMFAAAAVHSPSAYAVRLAPGDFDGDGITDLAAITYYGFVSVLLSSAGADPAPLIYRTSGGAVALGAADFNGDGKADIASASDGATINLLLNTCHD
jgi:hypothetical protein